MVQMNLFTTQKYCYRCRKLVVTKEGSRAVINWEINFEIHISDHLSPVFKYLQWFLMSVWRNVLILMQFEPLLLFLYHLSQWFTFSQRSDYGYLTCLWEFLWSEVKWTGYSVHGIFQARVLEWGAISFSRGSSRPRDRTPVSCIVGRYVTVWATIPI